MTEISLTRCAPKKVRTAEFSRLILRVAKPLEVDTTPANSELLGSFERVWRKHYPESDVVQVRDVERAMRTARESSAGAGGRTQTLITGSQLLVGDALSVLNGATVN